MGFKKRIENNRLPKDASRELLLNNSGQVAGNCQLNGNTQGFIWDPSMGIFYIGTIGKGQLVLELFNENWQAVGRFLSPCDSQWHSFLYDHGKLIDLNEEFNKQVRGVWNNIWVKALNNLGNVVVEVYNKEDKGCSFLYKDGKFSVIMSEKDEVQVIALGDDESMLVLENNYKKYFINQSKNIKYYFFDNGRIVLKNNNPVHIGSLSMELKKDLNGEFYYAPGLWIRKILPDVYPIFSSMGQR